MSIQNAPHPAHELSAPAGLGPEAWGRPPWVSTRARGGWAGGPGRKVRGPGARRIDGRCRINVR